MNQMVASKEMKVLGLSFIRLKEKLLHLDS